MTDQNSQFFAILTAVGEAKQANANALGVPWTFSQMGVGDANLTDPLPAREQTKLINERRRAPLNQLSVDPGNPSIIIAEQVIPPDVGGWWIREIGLYDAEGDLVAVANCAPSFKPLLSQGTGKTQVVRLNIIVTSTANVQLKIDPAVVLATRAYVDARIVEVMPATRPAGTYTKVTINARGVVTAGDNPTTLKGYGISDGQPLNSFLSALSMLGTPGLCARNTVGGAVVRILAVSGAGLAVANADGATGNPTFSLSASGVAAGTYSKVTVDALGRVTAGAGLTLSDLPNIGWGNIDERPTTLGGYGITDAVAVDDHASVEDAETGTSLKKWMSPARVFSAIAKKLVQATEAVMGVARVATLIEMIDGLSDARMVTPLKLKQLLARAQPDKSQCAAWVNFNGTGVVEIRDSYNISSITDNGVGNYTVNFAAPMVRESYAVTACCGLVGNGTIGSVINQLTASVTLRTAYLTSANPGAAADPSIVNVAIFGGK